MSMRPKTVATLRASAACPSHALAQVSVRDLTFTIDEPVERGGTNEGPSPTETVLAALIGCTNVIGHKCADRLGIEIGHLDISAACELDRRGVTLEEEIDVPFVRIRLEIAASADVSDGDLRRLAEETARYCPLSKLFRQAGTEIIEEWTTKAVR